MARLRLEIGPVIRNAEQLRERILQSLPNHKGLPTLAADVASAARSAETVSRSLKHPFGIHRLPVLFLAIALLILCTWLYLRFVSGTTLSIAIPDRDARELRAQVSRDRRLLFRPVPVEGSREAAERVANGDVDLAFVQGGLTIVQDLPRLETPHPEYVLWFLRPGLDDAGHVKRILTSLPNQGSHTVAQLFMKAWKIDSQVEYIHDWKRLTEDNQFVIPDTIDAVFVVKDPSDEKTLHAAERLATAGWQLASPDLGARALSFDFLKPAVIPSGYLCSIPGFPAQAVSTYMVTTYLVARRDLSPRMLAAASHLIEGQPPSILSSRFDGTVEETSEIFQGVDAFLGILINIVLAFLALTGFEMLAYRRRFHELNSLVSLISMHQSSKDVLGHLDPKLRQNNLLYLSLCSDLLGLVSAISGYYTQENSSLLFNNLPEIIHQRCDGLKINIQLKILHAMIDPESLSPPKGQTSSPEASNSVDTS